MAINSPIRLELPSAPGIKSPSMFNELLTVYDATRKLQEALTVYLPSDAPSAISFEVPDNSAYYAVNKGARLIFKAGATILAGRFLEPYVSGSEILVRHTRHRTGAISPYSLGLSLEDKSAGEFVTIHTYPSIIGGFSGLQAVLYYLYDDGQFSEWQNSPYVDNPADSANSQFCAFGVSPSQLLILGFIAL